MSRKLSDLHPILQEKAELFMQRCKEAGIKVVIYNTLRTFAEQDKLYSQGRTQPGRRVTNAPAGYSYHNYGLAFDFAFRTGTKGVTWNGPWDQAGKIAKSVGLEWGGYWRKFPDRPHCQYTSGLSINQLRAGKRLPEPVSGKNTVVLNLYKEKSGPKIYLLGKDGLYHHILNEETFKILFGGFDKASWSVGPKLKPSQIGKDINNN